MLCLQQQKTLETQKFCGHIIAGAVLPGVPCAVAPAPASSARPVQAHGALVIVSHCRSHRLPRGNRAAV